VRPRHALHSLLQRMIVSHVVTDKINA